MVARLKKKDTVVVISGKDKGKTGEIVRLLKAQGRAIVQGLNLAKRHTAASQAGPGGIVDKEISIHLSNLSHVDPGDAKPTRVGIKTLDDGKKVRYAKRSGEVIDL